MVARHSGGILQFPIDADCVVISRDVFESRMQNVAFESWSQLKATVSLDRKDSVGRNDSKTIVYLDPVRVFGWVAVILIHLCTWGIVAYLCHEALELGLVFLACYACALHYAISRKLAPALASILWPILPCTISVAGRLIIEIWFRRSHRKEELVLGLAVLPHFVSACVFLRKLPEDKDRASLVLNFFIGAWFSMNYFYNIFVSPPHHHPGDTGLFDHPLSDFSFWSLLFLGLASVVIAGRLWALPTNAYSSADVVSLLLNVGLIATFVALFMLLHLEHTEDVWRWVVFSFVILAIGFAGAVFERSMPLLLSAVGCFIVASYFSAQMVKLAGKVSDPTLVALASFGSCGIVIIAVIQYLSHAKWFDNLLAHVRRENLRLNVPTGVEFETRRVSFAISESARYPAEATRSLAGS
eukprot:TRINITY_DN55146_c0_g1_i2.p1 TRINITY_DN55146_c0_g1~~TRINITY_DN55146_c0_g1_i2.p1  ORF type:complete len:424 (-),score=29.43 TRINITY_DN55146_c0_g1_i2:25-1263(-)